MTNDEGSERPRKIVHVNMDAFYASVARRLRHLCKRSVISRRWSACFSHQSFRREGESACSAFRCHRWNGRRYKRNRSCGWRFRLPASAEQERLNGA